MRNFSDKIQNLYSINFFFYLKRAPYHIISYHIVSFTFIPWIRTVLQNQYRNGNSHICLRSLEVKSI